MTEQEQRKIEYEKIRDTLVTCLATKLLEMCGGTMIVDEAEVQRLAQRVIVIETLVAKSPYQFRFTTCSLQEGMKKISSHNLIKKPDEGQTT